MCIISTLYKTVLDALFPLSSAEQEVLSMMPTEAMDKLPAAPGYEGLAVDLPHTRSLFAYKDERVAKLVWNIKYKKSSAAVKIGGYALWQSLLTTAGSGSRVLLDTPSTSGEVAAGSHSQSCDYGSAREARGLPSLAPKRPENLLPYPLVVIPMPITEKRRRERGYNQCELLVDEIARLEHDACSDQLIIKKDLLVRTMHAARQTLKGRQDRVESAKGIFAINEKISAEEIELLVSQPVVIIDDVITTGSTIYEAIETLRKAGFQQVHGLSVAH
jgi:hypothetical protein